MSKLEFTKEERALFSKIGKQAPKKRFKDMTPEQVSAYMRQVRAGKKDTASKTDA